MKTLISAIGLLIAASSANASIQLNFSGEFDALSLVNSTGSLKLGDRFNGQLIFDIKNPVATGYIQPPIIPGAILGSNATTYFAKLDQHQSAAVSINNGSPQHSSFPLELRIIDNSEDFMSGPIYDQDGNQIGSKVAGTDGLLPSSSYDVVSVQSALPSEAFNVLPGSLLGGAQLPQPSDMTTFTLSVLFAAETFALDGVNPPNTQTIANASPLFWVFSFAQVANGQFSSALGLVDQHDLSEVPLPGAVWLFGSILAGWQFRQSRKASKL